MRKKWLRLIVPAGMLLLLSGCLFRTPDDLYRLPERSAGYDQLNAAIRTVRSELESEYGTSIDNAVIVSGENTATIQLQDLDGDGERESAITFLRVPGIEKAIKIYIFKQVDGQYRVTGIVEGDGATIHSVDYVDLNGSGRKEIVVNWQISTGVYQVGAYTLDELAVPTIEQINDTTAALQAKKKPDLMATELLLTGCSGYRLMDIDQDSRTEIAVAVLDSGGVDSYVEVYSWQEADFAKTQAPLSAGVVTLSRMLPDYLAGEYYTPALYVTCALTDGSKTVDVLAMRNGQLVNLALTSGKSDDPAVSPNILHSYLGVGPADINGDMVVELPSPRPLPSYEDSSAANFWLIDWSQYDKNGNCNPVMTTYHNVSDSWYLIIPDRWKDQITISRNDSLSGQREVVFSWWPAGRQEPAPFLSIYRLTGNNRTAHANWDGRFILREERDIIYAAQFYDCGWDCGLSQTELLDSFRTIQPSWNSD